jgi:nucleoside phosphorylase
MDTKQINLFVYDLKKNYNKSKMFLGEKRTNFKDMFCVESIDEFEQSFDKLGDDESIYLVVHVFYTENISGIRKYLTSGIPDKYPLLNPMFISDGDEKEIKHMMVDANLPHASVSKYHEVLSNLRDNKVPVYTKRQIRESDPRALDNQPHHQISAIQPKIDYAIITALYKDEFEELTKVFEFPKEQRIKTETKTYYRGYLKSNPMISVIAAIPNATGMVDSAIIATQMLEVFKPKYLIMSGVCGGSSDYNLGDIIVAKQIYTFQKGKLSDIRKKSNQNNWEKIDLYDRDNNLVDYTQLYDKEGNQIMISIEKFEIEHDAIINLNTAVEDALVPKISDIQETINRSIKIDTFLSLKRDIKIEIAPIACSTMVINKEGFFEDTIKAINRKTAAVEMESFGVARACQYANSGKTTPIIFKSVMDNTFNKEDIVSGINYKKFAAYTSAQFMKCLFDEKII